MYIYIYMCVCVCLAMYISLMDMDPFASELPSTRSWGRSGGGEITNHEIQHTSRVG